MLILNLDAVERGGAQLRTEIAPDDPLWADSGVTLREPLAVDADARSVGGGVLVRARLATTFALECRRCATEVESPFDEAIELLFERMAGDEEEADLAGEVYPLPPRGAALDLSAPLREQFLLRVPQYVVCDEACKGLCPHCGTNLNEATCDCTPEAEPSAWDALKQIRFD